MGDEAVIEFNYANQTTELKAVNRRNGRDAIHVIDRIINGFTEQLKENWGVLEDLNFALVGWGWQPLGVDDWHGTKFSGWAARLTPSEQ